MYLCIFSLHHVKAKYPMKNFFLLGQQDKSTAYTKILKATYSIVHEHFLF